MKRFLFFILLFSVFNVHARGGFLDSIGLDANEPPLVEDAFQFEATVSNANTVQARWQIMEGNYLYRDKLRFETDSADIIIDSVQLPEGEKKQDETFGLVKVYHHDLDIPLPLTRATTGTENVTITAYFQGCSETFGICYPPSQQQVTLTLPTITPSAGDPINESPPPPIVEQDKIAQTLAEDNLLQIILGFLGLGLLLTFTPCVLPMIPILSSIIVGEGDKVTTRRAFLLSLVYVLAMSITYTVAGVITGMLGANLQALFQNTWTLSAFSLLFVLLALSMFGLYELQLPSSLQTRLQQISHQQQGGKWLGVIIMGLLSGLIIGPCLAPPLAGALIFISQSADPLLGGLALFSLSMGMGIPLLIIGTSAGRLLPKAGSWMVTIKSIFGVLLIGLAIWMLQRIIPGWVSVLLWATLLIVSSIYMGALTSLSAHASGWLKLVKGLGVVMLVYGILLMLAAASGGHSLIHPLKNLTAKQTTGFAENAGLTFTRINNLDDLNNVLATSQQPVMLDFYADWCVDCKIMERTTFTDPRVIEALQPYQLVQVDMTDNNKQHQAMLKQLKVFGPPTMLFFDNNGDEFSQQRIVGLIKADKLLNHLSRLP